MRFLIRMLTVRGGGTRKNFTKCLGLSKPSATREQHWPFFLMRLVIRLGEAKGQHFDVNHRLPELSGISPALSTWILDYNLAQLKLTCPQNKSVTGRSKQLISQSTLNFAVSENNKALGKRWVKSVWKITTFFYHHRYVRSMVQHPTVVIAAWLAVWGSEPVLNITQTALLEDKGVKYFK